MVNGWFIFRASKIADSADLTISYSYFTGIRGRSRLIPSGEAIRTEPVRVLHRVVWFKNRGYLPPGLFVKPTKV
jgi:hypothetical protein